MTCAITRQSDLIVPLDLPHQLHLAQSQPAPPCLRRGAPRAHHGARGPSSARCFEPERAADDDRLLPDHEVQEVEEPRVGHARSGCRALAELYAVA